VLFDRDRAVGVRLAGPDGAEDVHADQVVLCAGALGSPSIPMHSGIGPADVLQPLGIPVTAELPVGRGLQDHMGLSVLSR
jgi:choline dehydrogenase